MDDGTFANKSWRTVSCGDEYLAFLRRLYPNDSLIHEYVLITEDELVLVDIRGSEHANALTVWPNICRRVR